MSANKDIYQEFFHFVQQGLSGYINDEWHFINVDLIANNKKNDVLIRNNSISTHLDDDGHEFVAEIISQNIYGQLNDYKMKSFGTSCM